MFVVDVVVVVAVFVSCVINTWYRPETVRTFLFRLYGRTFLIQQFEKIRFTVFVLMVADGGCETTVLKL